MGICLIKRRVIRMNEELKEITEEELEQLKNNFGYEEGEE